MEEGHSHKRICFSLQNAGFPYEIRLRFYDLIPSERFAQMASDKLLNYHSELWLLFSILFWAKRAPNSKIIALYIVKCIIG